MKSPGNSGDGKFLHSDPLFKQVLGIEGNPGIDGTMMPGKREALAKVLIIDDEEAVRALARRMLESGNHTVIEAADGVAGMKAFEEEKPDVIVTDIIMPNADGLEVIREIRRQNPEARIIVVSGGGRLPDQTYLGYARKLGATAVLPKPFTPEQLLSLIGAFPPTRRPKRPPHSRKENQQQ